MTINVKIAERPYPLNVDDEKAEEQARRAAQYINKTLIGYRERYSEKDMQDLLAIAAIQFVVRIIKLESDVRQDDANEKLKHLNSQLEEFLAESF
ncbi:MAG: cell division protein ZapA [Bacteroidales bacterium]|jgi:cell division protein ZapA|nr:cell division protein ZapA [Bacteroidales bacterium]